MSSGYQRIPGAWPEPLDSRSVIYQSEPRHLQQVVEFHRKLLPRSSSSRSLASGSVSAAAKVRDEVEITPPSVSRPDVKNAEDVGSAESRDEIEVPRAAHGMALQPIISHPAAVKSKLPELQLVSRTRQNAPRKFALPMDSTDISVSSSIVNSQLSSRISSHSLSSTVPSIPSPIAFASPSRSLSKSPRPILCNRSISDYVSDSTAQDSSFENSFQSSHCLLAHRRSHTSTPPKIRFQDHPAKVYTPIRRSTASSFEMPLTPVDFLGNFPSLTTSPTGASNFLLPLNHHYSPVEGEESWSLPDKLITPSFEKLLINEPPPDASDLFTEPSLSFHDLRSLHSNKADISHVGSPSSPDMDTSAVQYAEAVMDSSVWQPREDPIEYWLPRDVPPVPTFPALSPRPDSLSPRANKHSKKLFNQAKKFGMSMKSIINPKLIWKRLSKHDHIQKDDIRVIPNQEDDVPSFSSMTGPVSLAARRPRPTLTTQTFEEDSSPLSQAISSTPHLQTTTFHSEGHTVSDALHRRFVSIAHTKSEEEIRSRRRLSLPIISQTRHVHSSGVERNMRHSSAVTLPSLVPSPHHVSRNATRPPSTIIENSFDEVREILPLPPGLESPKSWQPSSPATPVTTTSATAVLDTDSNVALDATASLEADNHPHTNHTNTRRCSLPSFSHLTA